MKLSLRKILALANVRIRFRIGSRDFKLEGLGVPFIIGFQVLLLMSALFLIQDNSMLANEIAIYAYYLLVIGVFLQLLSFIGHKETEQKEDA